MNLELAENYKQDALNSFRSYKKLAERAIAQLSDGDFFILIDPEANSVALIVKHIGGNLHSRWRDFLNSDGEKPDRDRDLEFEIRGDSRESLMAFWESGWQTLFDNLEPLTPGDLLRTVTIRGEPHTVVEAINRQLTHYSYHIGQVVFLAKHLRSSEWRNLSVPKRQSKQFNRFLSEKQAKGTRKTNRFDVAAEFAANEERG